jgi:predicted nuclease of predicted toxin-antitoxin system
LKLLLDANLSWRLIKKLQPHFEEVTHVKNLNISQPAKDIEIWIFAKNNNFTIVTKDDDFEKLVLLRKTPPKVIYLKMFNSDTNQIFDLLIKSIEKIHNFSISNQDEILEIYN